MNEDKKDKKKELIQHIYSSLRAMDISKSIIRPQNYESCVVFNPVSKREENLREESTIFKFTISKSEMKFKFDVKISKIKKKRFYQTDRYATRVKIKSNAQYSTVETYYFDSKTDSSFDTQKNIFDYLMDAHNKKIPDNEKSKIESYISDIKKFDIAIMRDDKIDDILK